MPINTIIILLSTSSLFLLSVTIFLIYLTARQAKIISNLKSTLLIADVALKATSSYFQTSKAEPETVLGKEVN